jgi:hypothetical protein
MQVPVGRATILHNIDILVTGYVVRDEHSVYEWCMIYTDRDPRSASLYPYAAGQKERLQYLGAIAPLLSGPITVTRAGKDYYLDTRQHYRIANAVYQELANDIQTGAREPKRRAYLEDRPGELDPTLCVLEVAPILAIAERRGDGGEIIRKLVADWVKKRRPGRKAGAISVKDLACKLVLRILDDEAQRPPRGRGRLTTLAGMVNADLVRHGHHYKDDSVRKMIAPSVRDWEKKHRK